jgi:murein DD-endopeptidase MepM/ murein hydrolase activator NlpD/muramidase (phage lysozyme)
MQTKDIKLKLFAEGVEIPVSGASRTQTAGNVFEFSVNLPPTLEAFRVLPKTLIHVFIVETEGGKSQSRLFAEGYVTSRMFNTDIHGRRNAMLLCRGYDSIWSQVRLGLDIGNGVSNIRGLMHQMFVGLSAGDGEGIDILPGQSANANAQFVSFGDGANAMENKFLSLQYFLSQFMSQYGPMSGIVHTMANLAGASPLFKQSYNAARIIERILYRENFKVARISANDVVLQSLFSHIGTLPDDASLMDVLQLILAQTEHQYIYLPSPRFEKSALGDPTKEADTWQATEDALQIQGTGGWAWPTPSHTNVRSGVGRRRHPTSGKIKVHFGVDIPAPVGTPVYASQSGTCRLKGWQNPNNHKSGYGQRVRIDHAGGDYTMYAHLSSFTDTYQKGSVVRKGQLIGYVGNTGDSTGPHLHFEMRKSDGGYYNPVHVILGGGGAGSSNDQHRNTIIVEEGRSHISNAPGADRNSMNAGIKPEYRPTAVTTNSPCLELIRDPRVLAMLDLIQAYESDPDLKANPRSTTSSQDPYRKLYGGRFFTDMNDHPRESGRVRLSNGKTTSSAGAFQIQETTWDEARGSLAAEPGGVNVRRFTAKNQRLVAVAILKHKRGAALGQILGLNIRAAIETLKPEWAAFVTPPPGELIQFYMERLRIHDKNLPEEDMADLYKEMSGSERQDAMSSAILLVAESFEKHEPIEGALRQMVFVPRLRFSPPPTCNVFFPDRITNLQINEPFDAAPSRLMMLADPAGSYSFVTGGSMEGIITSVHFAPRYIQAIFDILRGGNLNGTLARSEAEQMRDLLEDYLGRLESLRAQGIDPEQAMTDPTIADAVYEAMAADLKGLSKEDSIRKILAGEEGLPRTLLGMHTYDELFRGIIPMIGRFPYKSSGLASAVPPSYEGNDVTSGNNAVEAANLITESLHDQARIINGMMDPLFFGDGTDASRQIYDQVEVSAEHEVVNLYANYQYAIMRSQPRQASLSMPLSLDVAVGFQGAIYDKSIGWVTGEIVQVTDSVDVQSKSAITQITMQGCRFLSDYDDPVWARIHAEADAEACSLAEDGTPESPLLFDEEFSAQKVGETIYDPVLGVGSVIDWAREHKREEDEDPNTIRKSLTIIKRAYESQSERTGAKSEWVRRFTMRPIATEANLMQEVLGAQVDAFGYAGTFAAWDIPDPTGTPFMRERRSWAKRFSNEMRSRNQTLSAGN